MAIKCIYATSGEKKSGQFSSSLAGCSAVSAEFRPSSFSFSFTRCQSCLCWLYAGFGLDQPGLALSLRQFCMQQPFFSHLLD